MALNRTTVGFPHCSLLGIHALALHPTGEAASFAIVNGLMRTDIVHIIWLVLERLYGGYETWLD